MPRMRALVSQTRSFFQEEVTGINPNIVRKQALAGMKWVLWAEASEAQKVRTKIFNCDDFPVPKKIE